MEGNFSVEMDPGMYDMSGSMSPEAMTGLGAGAGAFIGGMMIFALVIAVALYVYMAVCLMKIAKKTDTPNGWLAWIPIANLVLMIQIAQKPMWWLALFLLMFVPFVGAIVGIVLSVLLWMEICDRLGKEKWLGILMIIPIANLILPGYLAFSDSAKLVSSRGNQSADSQADPEPAAPEVPQAPEAGEDASDE